MGLLRGFVGGVANAAGQIADQRIGRYTAEMFSQQRDLAEQAKELRIEEMNSRRDAANRANAVADANAARTGAVSRIDAASGLIADERVAQTRGQVESGITDRSTWTPEQQAAVDQSLALDRKGLIGDPRIREQAARSTGDITPQQAALADADQRRLDAATARDDSRDASTNRRLDITEAWNKKQDEIRNRLASFQEARLGRMESKDGARIDKAELNSNRQSLQAVLKDIGTQEDKLQVQAAGLLDPTQMAVIQKQLKVLDTDRVAARNHLLSLAGIEPQKAEKPKFGSAAEALMGGEGTDAQYDQAFGKGAAKKVRDAEAAKNPTSPGATKPDAMPTSAAAQGLLKEKADRQAASADETKRASAQKDTQKDTRRAEADKITIEEIRGYSPTKAAEVYGKYRDVMPSDVLLVLRRRM